MRATLGCDGISSFLLAVWKRDYSAVIIEAEAFFGFWRERKGIP
jgi:hypothetical protein